MKKIKHQIEYYKKRAPEYEQIYYRDIPDRRKEIDNEAAALEKLAVNHQVLDIACGTGYWTEVIARSAQSVVACDISKEMIAEAKKKKYVKPVSFLQSDLYNIPLKSQSFDLVTLGFWFSHHPREEYDKLFELIKSMLTYDGIIWMIDNNPPAEGSKLESTGTDEHNNNFKKRYLDNGEEYIIIKNYFSKDELTDIFSVQFNILRLRFNKYYWSVLLQPKSNK